MAARPAWVILANAAAKKRVHRVTLLLVPEWHAILFRGGAPAAAPSFYIAVSCCFLWRCAFCLAVF